MRFVALLFIIISNSVFACPSGGGDAIKVIGAVTFEIFPGPPNYENIEEGDRPEKYWILTLNEPMCFSPDPDFMETEVTINKLQLLLYKLRGEVKLKQGTKYEFFGITVPAHTGHHKTKVMLEVESYKKL